MVGVPPLEPRAGRAMKSILIPTEDHDAMPAVLEGARLVARIFDSYMEGFAVHPAAGTYVAVEPVSSLAISGAFEHDAELATQARSLFESFMRTHQVPQGNGEPATYSYAWPRQEAEDDLFIGSYGRVFDLIALGRPGRAAQNPRMSPLEAALFDSGRPVLIMPPAVPATIGRNVLVGWNRSTEQANTNAFALPLLRLAERVTVFEVEGGTTPGPSAEEAAQHLRRNGVKAKALTVKRGARATGEATGEATLEFAMKEGCDLLVKGAYTQSRLRQMMFGGATRHILANAGLPVLMAH
jgi:nucleotide-binding universal stress UspA family protein